MKSRRPTRTIVTTAILGLALLSLAPLAAQARGDKGGPHHSPERAAECLTGQLDLTDEQRESVQAILEASFEQRSEAREARRSERRVERQAMRDATEAQLSEVLTAEQMNELRELREDRQDRRADRRGDRGRGCGQRGECGDCGDCRESSAD